MAQNIVLKGFKTAFYITRGLHANTAGHHIVIKGLGTTFYISRGLGGNLHALRQAAINMGPSAGGTIGTVLG